MYNSTPNNMLWMLCLSPGIQRQRLSVVQDFVRASDGHSLPRHLRNIVSQHFLLFKNVKDSFRNRGFFNKKALYTVCGCLGCMTIGHESL